MSLAIFFTYALQFYVPIDLMLPFFQRRYKKDANFWKFEVEVEVLNFPLSFGWAGWLVARLVFGWLVGLS